MSNLSIRFTSLATRRRRAGVESVTFQSGANGWMRHRNGSVLLSWPDLPIRDDCQKVSLMHPPTIDSSIIMRESLDELCQEIRRAMAPVVVHAVSLYDQGGGLLWMTSSVLNDDMAVKAAFERFKAAPTSLHVAHLGYDPGHHTDPRSAVVFRVADGRGRLVGAAMAVISTAALPNGPGAAANLLTEPVRRLLNNFARLRSGTDADPEASASAARAPDVAPADAVSGASRPARVAAPSSPMPAVATLRPERTPAKPASPVLAAAPRPARALAETAQAMPPPAKTADSEAVPMREKVISVRTATMPPTAAKPRNGTASSSKRAPASNSVAPAKIPPMVPTADRAPVLPIADSVPRAPSAKSAAVVPITKKVPVVANLHSAPIAPPVKTTPAAQRPPSQATVGNPLHEAVMRSPLALYVQRFVPLEKGNRQKRYELLWEFKDAASARSLAELKRNRPDDKPSSVVDRRVFDELLAWLKQHPQVGQDRNTTLTIKLSRSALYDPDFVPFVARSVQKSGVPKGMIGFEIPAVTPRKSVAAITKLALLLRQTGCFLALDNFSLRTEAFNSLHLPGVALIKLSHEVTVKMQRDKLARAGISAMTQMARVLGIQVVAKRTKLAADLVRLSSFRVDFVQSESISPALPIAALANRRSPSAIVAGSHTPVPTARAT